MNEEISIINQQYKKIYCHYNSKRAKDDAQDKLNIEEMFRSNQEHHDNKNAEGFNNEEVYKSIPSLRFSEEVLYMLRIIYDTISTHHLFKKKDDQISS